MSKRLRGWVPLSSVPVLLWFAWACETGPGAARERTLLTPELQSSATRAFADNNCAACHLGGDAPAPNSAPRLDRAGARLTHEYLRDFLADPHAAKPGTAMPNLFAGWDEDERNDAVDALAQFLASLGGPTVQEPFDADFETLERGRQLYHSVGCVACHAPYEWSESLAQPLWEFESLFEAAETEIEPGDEEEEEYLQPGLFEPKDYPIANLRRKTTLEELTAFLVDPLAVRPDGRMPSMSLTAQEAQDIATYLWFEESVGTGIGREEGAGLFYEYFEETFDPKAPDFGSVTAVRSGVTGDLSGLLEHRSDRFGFRYRGFVTVPTDGVYTFYTYSDDGSYLEIDGELIVDNGGTHPMTERSGDIHLTKGRHAIQITFFERDGGEGLSVSWKGPGFEKEILPGEVLSYWKVGLRAAGEHKRPRLDGRKVAKGKELFRSVGCISCHEIEELAWERKPLEAPALSALGSDVAFGCLSDRPRKGVPQFAMEAEDSEALRRALQTPEELAAVVAPGDELHRSLERLSCYACHRRDDFGGPHPSRRDYFFIAKDVDLGDEGRIPPHLDRVGGKLHRGWMEDVLFDGGSSRPYMKTRMPQFGEENVERLVDLFQDLDGRPEDLAAAEFTVDSIADGRRLVGTEGLGCIQCHDFAGYPSLGIPAVDLVTVHERIKPAWFKELLMDPAALNMNTRMPAFWEDGGSPVKDLYGGDPERQVEAIWNYLSLGRSMPLPPGLVVPEGEYELEPRDEPILCGVFMRGVSPRTVLVGYPERVHVAFDMQGSRLAKAWRGRFFNARGTWHGRAGELESPPGDPAGVLDFPAGGSFAVLAAEDTPWPSAAGRDAGYRPLGRRFDGERRPIFRYAFDAPAGEVTVEERPLPVIAKGGARLLRSFSLSASAGESNVWMRVAVGDSVQEETDGRWSVDGKLRLRVASDGRPRLRPAGDRVELLVPVAFDAKGAAALEVELWW